MMSHLSSRRSLLVLAILLCYFLLALGRALTMSPWNDEAWYSSPSWSFIHDGTFATPLLETAGQFWKGIDIRTYWVVPLQFFAQIPWFKVFGFSGLAPGCKTCTDRCFVLSYSLLQSTLAFLTLIGSAVAPASAPSEHNRQNKNHREDWRP